MSSTSNAQNLLVNVFRPTYVYEAGVGYTPSLVLSNVDKVVSTTVVASNVVVNDPGSNVYIGSNAGNSATNVRASSNNVAVGYNAGNGFSNTSNTVAVGYNALGGSLSNVSNTVAIGANTIGGGVNNILIGHDTGTIGSNNILIGPNQTPGIVTNKLRVGSNSNVVLAADLASQYVGINNVDPIVSFDVSGQAYFRNKVGIQVEAPTKSLEVNGETYSSIGFLAGRGTVPSPAYAFYADGSTGMYSPGNGYGSLVANGQPYITFGAGTVNFHNRTFVNADISGGGGAGGPITLVNGWFRDTSGGSILTDISEGNMYAVANIIYSGSISNTDTTTSNVIGGVVLSNGDVSANTYNGPGGTANAPHYTFSDDRTTGLFFPGTGMIGLTAGGTERVRVSNSFVGIGTTAPASALDVSGGLRVIGGSAGIVTLSNGTINAGVGINISGTPIVSSNGAFVNGSSTSNQIGGVTLSNTNIVFAGTISNSTSNTSNVIGGVVISNGILTAGAGSNRIGGVTLSASNVVSGTGSNSIGGVTLSNTNLTLAGTITGSTANTSNVIGGIVLSNGVLSNSDTAGPSWLGKVRIGPSPTYGIITDSTVYNTLGGISLSNGWLESVSNGFMSNAYLDVIRNSFAVPSLLDMSGGNIGFSGRLVGSTSNASNVIGGVVLSNNNITTSTINVATAGSPTSASFYFFNQSNLGFYGANANEVAFVSSNGERLRFNQFGIYNDSNSSNTLGGVILTNNLVRTGAGTAGTPTYTFSNDTATGLFSAGTNRLGFATAGVQRVVLSNDSVGIGTTTPAYTLDISSGNTASTMRLQANTYPSILLTGYNDGSSGQILYDAGAATNRFMIRATGGTPITFETPGNAERMRVAANGNVGIGRPDPSFTLDVSGSLRISNASLTIARDALALPGQTHVILRSSNNARFSMNLGPVETGSGNGGADLLFQTYTDAGGLLNSNALVVKRSSGYVGVGKSTPVYALDVSAGPGLASVNMTSWARFPVSNMLMAIAENTQLGGLNGGAYNFSNPIQTMDSNLITFTNSNASVGSSFVIKKTGIWSINFLFATGNGQYVFIDVSTGNIASNSYGSNNSLPIAFGGQGGGGVASVSYTGYLPSNDTYIYKFRGGSNLSAVGYSKNILQITFLGETPNSGAAFPF